MNHEPIVKQFSHPKIHFIIIAIFISIVILSLTLRLGQIHLCKITDETLLYQPWTLCMNGLARYAI